MRGGTRCAAAATAVLAAWLGCAGPVVQSHVQEIRHGALRHMAVVSFEPSQRFRGDLGSGEPKVVLGAEAAALVTRIVTESFLEAGFEMVPASDLTQSYAASGETLPRGDVRALAQRAAEKFGVTAVLLGTVVRYHERVGGELGSTRPASVAFDLAIHAAPSGERLWTARFDHTQRAFSAAPFQAYRYPGGGTRWLSAAELARWGAAQSAELAARLP